MIKPRFLAPALCLFLAVIYCAMLSVVVDQQGTTSNVGHNLPLTRRIDPSTLTFNDIEIDSVKGVGAITVAFKVRIPKLDKHQDYIMKVNADSDVAEYAHVEAEAFHLLSVPPVSPSIPPLIFQITSLLNPFQTWSTRDLRDLGLSKEDAEWLVKAKSIGFQVFPLVPHTGFPSDNLPELQRFMRSLLQALDFAHTRGVMNCDIHSTNLAYDQTTGTVYLFDWNAARIYVADQVPMWQKDQNRKILPPEALGDNAKEAVHVTVSGVDIYASGIVLNKLLCGEKVCDSDDDNNNKKEEEERKLLLLWGQAQHLASWMMTDNPLMRPSAAQLLKHPFVATAKD